MPPAIYGATYGLNRLIGLPVPTPQFPVLATLVQVVMFLVAGLGEELGWSGYAIEPIQARWNALRASLLLGTIWTTFHFIPLRQGDRALL